jgi:hypothetical protein
VPLGEDLRQLRDGLLGAVLLIAADEDDVLALAGAVLAVEDDAGVRSAALAAMRAISGSSPTRANRKRFIMAGSVEEGAGWVLRPSV